MSSQSQEERNIPVVIIYEGALPDCQMNRVVGVTSTQMLRMKFKYSKCTERLHLYKIKYAPSFRHFPDFPIQSGYQIKDAKTGMITGSNWFWILLTD